MSLRIARPLPECRVCETPVRRQVFIRNGGLCSTCLEVIGDTQVMGGLRPLVEPDDPTVYVERYIPPVPPARGQLALPVCGCADPRDCGEADPCDIEENSSETAHAHLRRGLQPGLAGRPQPSPPARASGPDPAPPAGRHRAAPQRPATGD